MYLVGYYTALWQLADDLSLYTSDKSLFSDRTQAGQFLIKKISPFLTSSIQDAFSRKVVELKFSYNVAESEKIKRVFSENETQEIISIEETSLFMDIRLSDSFYSFGFVQPSLLKRLLSIYDKHEIKYTMTDLTSDYYIKMELYNWDFQQMIDLYIEKQLAEQHESLDQDIEKFILTNQWETVYQKFKEFALKSNNPKILEMARIYEPYKLQNEHIDRMNKDSSQTTSDE